MAERETNQNQANAYESQYGDDPDQIARAEHGLLINGIPFGLLYDYAVRNGLSPDGDIYTVVHNHLRGIT